MSNIRAVFKAVLWLFFPPLMKKETLALRKKDGGS